VAASINRRKTPTLVFQVVGRGTFDGQPHP
jgi:hypothetical protein